MEHWLPLFHDKLDTLFDYLPNTPVVLEPLDDEAANERLAQITDYYEARRERSRMTPARLISHYRPSGFTSKSEWDECLRVIPVARLTPFAVPGEGAIDIGARQGRNFAAERTEPGANVFDAVNKHVLALQAGGKRVLIALWSDGSRERMRHVLSDHGLANLSVVASWSEALALPKHQIGLGVLGLESGFETTDFAVIGEQDILGDRLVQPRRAKRAENFIAEVTSLSAGDLVVPVDHGIGRFIGLNSIEAAGAPHDCLEIHYAGGDRLFLPVENIDLLSRYGSQEAGVDLDRLGGTGWQTRKARLKRRILEMANELIKVAAERKLREAPRLAVGVGLYDEFCAGFPYEETDDQQGAIDATIDDLAAGRPMDRLVCGDVGFGKTEVALRAAFAAVMNGKQVAVVVPTTLLARQHLKTFTDRFRGVPVKLAQPRA
jgi:transcription-repair coupling factor (superfamily II helicase)